MAPSLPPGEARPSPKPQPIGSFPLLILFTTATACVLFVLWRRSETLRIVVAHQLKTWTRQEGAVRLSEDDGPPAHSFLGDDEDQEDVFGEGDDDDDSLGGRANSTYVPPVELIRITRMDGPEDVPPPPPPKDRARA